jgi:uncharacterized protein (DUF1778 family)
VKVHTISGSTSIATRTSSRRYRLFSAFEPRQAHAWVFQKCYTRSQRYAMPTKNPRINVALEKPIYALIKRLAQERGLSLSMVTRDLVREALEIHEDAVLVRFADQRVAALAGRKTMTHAESWKKRCPTASGIIRTSKRRTFPNSIEPSKNESRPPPSRGFECPRKSTRSR